MANLATSAIVGAIGAVVGAAAGHAYTNGMSASTNASANTTASNGSTFATMLALGLCAGTPAAPLRNKKGEITAEFDPKVVIPGFKTQMDRFKTPTFVWVGDSKVLAPIDPVVVSNCFAAYLAQMLEEDYMNKCAVYIEFPIELTQYFVSSRLIDSLQFGFHNSKQDPDSYKRQKTSVGPINVAGLQLVKYLRKQPGVVSRIPMAATSIGGAKLMPIDPECKKVLFAIERTTRPDGNQVTTHNLIGGGVDLHESHMGALLREAREEAMLEIPAHAELRLVGGYMEGSAREGGVGDTFIIVSVVLDPTTVLIPDGEEVKSFVWMDMRTVYMSNEERDAHNAANPDDQVPPQPSGFFCYNGKTVRKIYEARHADPSNPRDHGLVITSDLHGDNHNF
jgi:ADP-ribose pyrophosphatase YjhB (NUDIX family)